MCGCAPEIVIHARFRTPPILMLSIFSYAINTNLETRKRNFKEFNMPSVSIVTQLLYRQAA